MSAEVATTPTEFESAREAHALAFRIAFAAAFGLTLGEVLGWDFPFLPPLLAVQLLASSGPPSLRQSLGFIVLVAAACAFAVLIAQIFVNQPVAFVLLLSLLIFFEFLFLARGQAVAVAGIFLITTPVVPLLAMESMEIANAFVYSLIAGSVLAVLLTFAAHAFFPSRVPAEPGPRDAPQEQSPVPIALANTAVLMSLVILFMVTGSPVSVVVLLTVITILRQPSTLGTRTALGLVLGNVAGGVAATVAYFFIVLFPNPVFLLLVVLFAGLIFGNGIAGTRDMAPIYTVGLATFLIVLGLGLSPLPQDSSAVFVSRVLNVVFAAVYAIAMASVLRALFRASREVG
jgi:Protein of unknown function (DUF2955)